MISIQMCDAQQIKTVGLCRNEHAVKQMTRRPRN